MSNTLPGVKDLVIYQGDTCSFTVTYKEGPVGSEVGVDLTGAGLSAQFRNRKTDPVATASFSVYADPDQVTFPGKMYLFLDAANSELLTESRYFWDLEIEWPTATPTVQTILAGAVAVTKDVTR